MLKIKVNAFFGCKKGCKTSNYLIYTLVGGERGLRTLHLNQRIINMLRIRL